MLFSVEPVPPPEPVRRTSDRALRVLLVVLILGLVVAAVVAAWS
jgi:hypothetical protein